MHAFDKPTDQSAKTQTDWKRVDTMTDEDIARAVADDPEAAPILSYDEIKTTYKPHPPRIKR